MKQATRLLAFSLWLLACPAGLRAERVLSNAAWEHQFPLGIVDFVAMQLTPNMRYLAITTGRFVPGGGDGTVPAAPEGENAAYYFDLRGKRLLWKIAFPDDVSASVVGLSPSGDVVALRAGGPAADRTQAALRAHRGGSIVKGTRVLGTPEPGARAYDREGRLMASGVPFERFGDALPHAGRLLLRPAREGEAAPSDDLRQTLTSFGITAVAGFAARGPYGFRESAGHTRFVSFADDGDENWRWELPADECQLAREWRSFAVSPDLGHTLLSLTPYDGEQPSAVRHLYLFGRTQGLVWEQRVSMAVGGRYPATSIGVQVANGASRVLIVRAAPQASVADVIDRSGALKRTWEFGGIQPTAHCLSPNGRYWAAGFRTTWQGPAIVDEHWSPGIYVFDCDTGDTVWRSTAMTDATYVMVTDAGRVVAASATTRMLAVFDPQIQTTRSW